MKQLLCCSINPFAVCSCRHRFCLDCMSLVTKDRTAEWLCPNCKRTWKEKYAPEYSTLPVVQALKPHTSIIP